MKIIPAGAIMVAGLVTGFALPLQAQEGNVSMGYFVTTDLANVVQLEEGMRGHVDWHAQQNDPWPGFIYQAMHGGVEYVWVSPNHSWADFDNPSVDSHADMVDFAERAGSHTTGIDIRTWVTWEEVSMSPAPDQVVPIWQVIEWDLRATAEGVEALRSAFGKVKAAFEQQGIPNRYTVNEVVGIDGGPQMFVAIAHDSMGELDEGEPGALQGLLAETYGHAEAIQITRTFEEYLTPTANRIWVLRPDLSHMPGM
ncbi:MAG TPA: hypothetical protein VK858_04805 [Longimicrobiales bacterium]|nr:hypothetical protein [Longimicrobiales bacterium]